MNNSNKDNKKQVKIALIDTGVVTEAVNNENILPGWNYCTDTQDTTDIIGHGTSLCSIILGSEKAGLSGYSPESYVVPLVWQTEDEQGEKIKIDIKVLAQIIRDAVDKYECDIISISAGVKTDYSEIREAVKYAYDKGAIIISGAGNEGNSEIYYPGGYDEVLCVGSANEEMNGCAVFSQQNDTVDILAPGQKISVTTMKGNEMKVSGTSYSAAYATAAVARIWENNPEMKSQNVVKELKKRATTVDKYKIISME